MHTDSNQDKNKVLVFGASLKEARASNRAVKLLQSKNNEVVAIGGRNGMIENVPVQTELYHAKDIHTITLYMGEKRQQAYLKYFLSLEPKRIVFNPGAENLKLFYEAQKQGIEVINACTLVMLTLNDF
jgi:predicted CoA-binding protein